MTDVLEEVGKEAAENWSVEGGSSAKALSPDTWLSFATIIGNLISTFIGQCSGSSDDSEAQQIVKACNRKRFATRRATYNEVKKEWPNGSRRETRRRMKAILQTGAEAKEEEVQEVIDDLLAR